MTEPTTVAKVAMTRASSKSWFANVFVAMQVVRTQI